VRFAGYADAGRRLAPLLEPLLADDPLVVSLCPGGHAVAAAAAAELGIEVVALPTFRDADGVRVEVPTELVGAAAGRTVVVVDDGVETGTSARAAAAALRPAGPGRLVLVVPVCPRQAEVGLRGPYDDVLALVRPLAGRSLRWHYDTFA